MKAIEALNKVWDTLHFLEAQLTKGSVKSEEVREAKRTVEKALMIMDNKGLTISRDTEL